MNEQQMAQMILLLRQDLNETVLLRINGDGMSAIVEIDFDALADCLISHG